MNYDRKTKTELIAEIERLKALVDENMPTFDVQLISNDFKAVDSTELHMLLENFVETNPFMVENSFYVGNVVSNSWSSSNC